MLLIKAFRALDVEVGKLRYKLNVGTARCENCDGLRAGPGVSATCFQVQRCDFTNVKEEAVSPGHRRILESIIKTPSKRS
jgi:hypothetical protein